MTDYKMPPLRPNGNATTLSRPHAFPLPDDTVVKDTPPGANEPQASPAAPPAPVEAPRRGVLAKVSDAIAREGERAAKARGAWGEHPPSLSVLRQWIHTTRWYCSESALKRALAWMDGYLRVLPGTVLIYVMAWIWQRFYRVLVALLFLAIIYYFL